MKNSIQNVEKPQPIKKIYDYDAFISEIWRLRDQASIAYARYEPENEHILHEEALYAKNNNQQWKDNRWRVESPEFEMWLEQLKHHVAEIGRLNYPIKIQIQSRDFQTTHADDEYIDSRVGKENAFLRDLRDTIREMTIVIDHFEKYGTPEKSLERKSADSAVPITSETTATLAPTAQNTGLDPDKFFKDKPSIKWLALNMPGNWWLSISGLVVTSFIAGTVFDHYFTPPQAIEVQKQVKPIEPPVPTTPASAMTSKAANSTTP